MNKLFLLLYMLFLSVVPVFSQSTQERPDYKLLWKVSGNDLSKPSYLFGTMHVSDDLAFDFSDSVILKLLECEAFAMEVHPDTAIIKVLDMVFGNSSDKNKFKEIFSKEEYSRLDSLLKERSGYSLDKLKSPWLAEFILEKANKKKKNDKAFLDAYLFGLAKNNSKEIFGLEDVEQQLRALDYLSPKDLKEKLLSHISEDSTSLSKTADVDLLKVYHSGDIEEIYEVIKYLYRDSEEAYNELITKRNEVMSASIIREIHNHSSFIAVGAAHLPGEEGLISLLQKKGYQVTKVTSKFSGLASKYKYKTEDKKWLDYSFEKAGYSLRMPIKPIPYKIDSLGRTFNMAFDIASNAIYQTTYLSLGNLYNGKESKEIFDQFEKNLKNSTKRTIGKSIKINVAGLEGREYTIAEGGNFFRTRYILRGNMLYILMAGPTLTIANSTEAQTFFDSFKIFEFKDEKWKDFKVEQGGFSIKMYGEPDLQKIDHEDPRGTGTYHFNIYTTNNSVTNETYILRYNDFPAGVVSTNDSVYHASLINDIFNRIQGTDLKQRKITYKGFPGQEFVYKVGADGLVKGRTILRGSRCFLLLTTSIEKNDRTEVDFFLNSLDFTGYVHTPFKEYSLTELNLKIKFPSEPEREKDDSEESIYNSIDKNTGISYILVHKKLSKYSNYDSPEEFFKEKRDEYFSEAESVLTEKEVKINDLLGYEATISSTIVHSTKRVQFLLNGLDFYILLAYLPKDYVSSPNANLYFESAAALSKDIKGEIFGNKSDVLLKELVSLDTVILKEAKDALRTYDFKASELPQIHKALSIAYPDDNDGYGSTRDRLFNVVSRLDDEKSIDFIRLLFPELPKENEGLRSKAIKTLMEFKTKEATKTALNILINDSLRTDHYNGYSIFMPLYDTLSLVPVIFPEVFKFLPFQEYQGVIFDLAQSGLDSGVFSPEQGREIDQQINSFINALPDSYFSFRTNDSLYYQKLDNLANLTELTGVLAFNSNLNTFLEKVQKSGHTSIMVESTVILAGNNKSIKKEDLELIAADPLSRIRLFEKLQSIGKENIFPKKYLSQKSFAESELMGLIEYEDGLPEVMEFVSKKMVTYQGGTQEVYIYKFKYLEDKEWYIGLAGPFPIKSKQPSTTGALTNYSFDTFDKKTLNNTIKSLLEGTEAKLIP